MGGHFFTALTIENQFANTKRERVIRIKIKGEREKVRQRKVDKEREKK